MQIVGFLMTRLKCKIVTFGLKIFQENVFIQTTVYMLPVWCRELEKQLGFQIFKNGWLLSNFKNLHFRKKITDFENRFKTRFKVKKNKKTSRATSALDTSVVLESVF